MKFAHVDGCCDTVEEGTKRIGGVIRLLPA